jgi:plasmid replication initiation protein
MNLVTKELSKRLLLKHTATVHSSSRLTMVQKKIFNLFIYKAFPTIQDDKYHTFKVSDLMHSLNWSEDSHVNDRLKDALAGLTRENVKWNILEKDRKNKWVSSACLADVSIKNGIIEYSFGKFLREVLHNPNIYAKIDLDVQSTLESRDSLIIWEFAVEELSSKKTTSTITPWIEWEKMCSITSGEGSAYAKTYSLYKSKVLNKAIMEINTKTDLKVKMIEQKEGRKVKRIAFQVVRFNKEDADITSLQNNTGVLDRDIILKNQLEYIIGSPEKAKELWLKYSDDTLKGAIGYYKETLVNPEHVIKNPVAFFKKALEEGWHPLADALVKIEQLQNLDDKKEEKDLDILDKNEQEPIRQIRALLLQSHGSTLYTAWFKEASFQIQEDKCIINHPNVYAQTYIIQQLYQPTLTILQQIYPKIKSFDVCYQQYQLTLT